MNLAHFITSVTLETSSIIHNITNNQSLQSNSSFNTRSYSKHIKGGKQKRRQTKSSRRLWLNLLYTKENSNSILYCNCRDTHKEQMVLVTQHLYSLPSQEENHQLGGKIAPSYTIFRITGDLNAILEFKLI